MKKINVHNPNNLPTIPFQRFEDLQGDLKTISKNSLQKLKNSIKKYGIFVPKFVWENNGYYYLIDGHQTKKALAELEKEGYEVPEIPYVKVEAKNKREAAEKLLQINSRYGKINPDTTFLEDFEIDFSFLDEIEIPELEIKQSEDKSFSFREGKGFLDATEKDEDFFLTDEEKAKFEKYEYILVQFSGGKDSTVALIWAVIHFPEKHILVVFSDTGVEFPGMGAHIADVAEFFKVDWEIVKPKKEWWAWIKERGWPSIIFRPCQSVFIHQPLNDFFSKFPSEKTLIIDGSRAKQSVRGSEKTKTSKLPDEKIQEYDAYHPCFGLTDEAFNKILREASPPLWKGYEQGFVRSACWCCPGQCGRQAYMLNKIYPGLADEIKWWEKKKGPFRQGGKGQEMFFNELVKAGTKKIKGTFTGKCKKKNR